MCQSGWLAISKIPFAMVIRACMASAPALCWASLGAGASSGELAPGLRERRHGPCDSTNPDAGCDQNDSATWHHDDVGVDGNSMWEYGNDYECAFAFADLNSAHSPRGSAVRGG